ncbi:hypothetical protein LZG04_31715 [Saccharothrix sp. S26]|uniref:NACHT domain-containing protein n=1 Tax=Saccharothrix sp. S26 TaxID=2907215 RepID=UPI001F17E8EA|nr:AAA family ATPase [Saccharothrix sp. S26]MCE6999343.1 hypothetical protein [Saccharothrix sp. S26]
MRRSFSYGDAVKLLGGDTGLVKLLDHVSAATVLATGGIDLLDARTEVVRVGRQLLSSLRERVTGLHRVDRTRLLEAAHSVLVTTSFFEALDEIGLPFNLKITKVEQLVLAGGERLASKRRAEVVRALLDAPIPLPSAERPAEDVVAAVALFYRQTLDQLLDFLSGFGAWGDLPQDTRHRFVRAAGEVPDRAVALYRARYRQLAVDCPEFSVWTSGIEHAATRAEVRTALEDMRALLQQLVGSQPPDDRRHALARAHRAQLDRPIVEGEVPSGLVLPKLRQAYVSPSFKVVQAGPGDDVSQDGWWSDHPVRTDLDDYLAGYFTSSQATAGPLVVLGQPGAGKSLLTRMLAAQLPAEDFLPIRVVLRDVPADATLQDQVEDAVTRATGERLDWPDLARAAAPAVPVVLLDGFDELLQATGISKSDYLARVRDFQRREAEQGRAVIVVVTSRIAVANRARFADATAVLKLEPFGDDQVRRWLDVWNAANPGAVLLPEVALRFPDLAGQPLLLFMLALYNADGNVLRTEGAELAKATLYEQLLIRFARREVAKNLPGALDDRVDQAAEEELIRLSVVAFAMFNRGVQWIDEAELDDDLNALLHTGPRGARDKLRLSSAQLAVGRFFFVHAARAAHDGRVSQTYEFLHATFGEYLVARLVHRVSLDVLARERAANSRYGRQSTDTGWLEPVLSFAPLTTRAPVVSFLRELFDTTAEDDRMALHDLFTALVDEAQHRLPGADHPDYLPRALPVARRIAACTANLVTLAVAARGRLAAADLDRTGWSELALLWQSQLDAEEWARLADALHVERLRVDGRPTVAVVLRDGQSPPPVDLAWLCDLDPGTRGAALPPLLDEFRRDENLHGSWSGGHALHNLEPLMAHIGPALNWLVPHQGEFRSFAWLLLTVQTSADPVERVAAFTTALLALQDGDFEPGPEYWTLLFAALARDEAATVPLLQQVVAYGLKVDADPASLIGCAVRLLGMTGRRNFDAVYLLDTVLADGAARGIRPNVVVEALVCFIELGLDLDGVHAFAHVPELLAELDLAAVAASDRHLHLRLRRALESIGLDDHMAR